MSPFLVDIVGVEDLVVVKHLIGVTHLNCIVQHGPHNLFTFYIAENMK